MFMFMLQTSVKSWLWLQLSLFQRKFGVRTMEDTELKQSSADRKTSTLDGFVTGNYKYGSHRAATTWVHDRNWYQLLELTLVQQTDTKTCCSLFPARHDVVYPCRAAVWNTDEYLPAEITLLNIFTMTSEFTLPGTHGVSLVSKRLKYLTDNNRHKAFQPVSKPQDCWTHSSIKWHNQLLYKHKWDRNEAENRQTDGLFTDLSPRCEHTALTL